MPAPAPTHGELLDRLATMRVEDRARALGDGPFASSLLAELIEHADRLAQGGAADSDQTTDMLVNLADRIGSQLHRARARRVRARALAYAGRFREALSACEEGQRLAHEAGDSIEEGRARLASMHALAELGRLDDAIDAGEAARQAFLDAGEPDFAARADLNIGTAHQRRDDPTSALAYFDRARPLLARQPAMLGPLDNNRGEALLALNEFGEAERAFVSALENFTLSQSPVGAAIAESNLADLATRQGRLQKAMRHFELARRRLEGGGSPAHLARLLAEQAELMSMLGMTEEAIGEYERALTSLDQQGLALESARARAGLGAAMLRLGHRSAAETALAASARGFDELQHQTARARVDLRRAELAAANGRLADGRAIAMRSLASLHDRPADAAAARLTLARLASAAHRPKEALAELNHALTLAEQLQVAPLAAEILQERAAINGRAGFQDQAIDDLRSAADQIDRVRDALQAERFRTAFLGHRTSVYEDLVTALLDRNAASDVPQAFEMVERCKSRALVESMNRDLVDESASLDLNKDDDQQGTAAILKRLHEARTDLNALYSVLRDERTPVGRHDQSWRDRAVRTEQLVDELEARLATTADVHGSVAASVRCRPMTVEVAAATLTSDVTLIEYFVAGDEIIAFILKAGALQVVRHVGSIAKVLALMQSLQFQINRALRPGAQDGGRGERLVNDANHVLQELAVEVVRRVAPALAGSSQILIVPHGALHGLPFHALPINGRPLMESHAISYVPSLTMLAALADRPRQARPLIVGVADEFAPQMEDEARDVAGTFASSQPTLLLGTAALAERVLSAAAEASLVHMACHGRYAPESPMSSGLRLADRWVTARDFSSTRLRAELVTLSGCETGLNLVKAGDELLGLQRGFFVSGASRVLASLWRVDDATTREFMVDFYGCVNTLESSSETLAVALQRAQSRIRSSHPHPALWASFVLAGRP